MIGVVGEATDAFETTLEATGTVLQSGPVGDVVEAGPDAIVAVGESAVIDLVGGGAIPDVPILVVDARGFPDVGDGSDLDTAGVVADLASGSCAAVRHPVLGVTVGEERVGQAAFDAMVVTNDRGGISEYRVETDGDLCQVRADGVVVATPAGSHGYARSAGGSRIRLGADALAVVPVAAFAMSHDRWVVDAGVPVEIATERDVPVSLLLDDERREVRSDSAITIEATDTITLAVPDSVG